MKTVQVITCPCEPHHWSVLSIGDFDPLSIKPISAPTDPDEQIGFWVAMYGRVYQEMFFSKLSVVNDVGQMIGQGLVHAQSLRVVKNQLNDISLPYMTDDEVEFLSLNLAANRDHKVESFFDQFYLDGLMDQSLENHIRSRIKEIRETNPVVRFASTATAGEASDRDLTTLAENLMYSPDSDIQSDILGMIEEGALSQMESETLLGLINDLREYALGEQELADSSK